MMFGRPVRGIPALGLALVILAATPHALAQTAEEAGSRMDLYGFAMLDMGYETGQSDPDWFDVMRPTKLPSFEDQFGGDGHTFAGVRQSRLGVKAWMPTSKGEIKTIFEFELFGVGVDAGQTTFRLRHAYGEFGHWGAGQTWSPFMDPDVFPNSIEYWGPNGMVFFRNVQVRWMPLQGDNSVTVALERPGASGDPGTLVGSPQVTGLTGRFPLPDLSAHFRMKRDWGHVQIAGILRRMEWDDTDGIPPNLSGSATGWGINVSSNLKFSDDTLRLQVAYGEGIANYMNDATADVGAVTGPDVGEALPVLGVVAFYDRTWSSRFTSTFGYSMLDIDNSNAQTADAFKKGQYALANLLYHPVPNLMWGGELQWGKRENNDDGGVDLGGNTVESFDDWRLQFSVKYNFSHSWGGKS
jgi:outer membrane DcaP-like protein